MSDEMAIDNRGKTNFLTVLGLEEMYNRISSLELMYHVFNLCVEVKMICAISTT